MFGATPRPSPSAASICGRSQLVKYGAAGGSCGCWTSASVGNGLFFQTSYSAWVMSCCATMSRSTTLRRARAALGLVIGSNALGASTIPASIAASQASSRDAHEGLGASPQPEFDWPGGTFGSYPCSLPKYTRAADSTP